MKNCILAIAVVVLTVNFSHNEEILAFGPSAKLTTMGAKSPPSSSSSLLYMAHPKTAADDDDDDEMVMSRRNALTSIATFFGTSSLMVGGNRQDALALDMDSFVNSQLEQDTKNCDPKKDPKCIPKLTSDEALCKYGQNGEARGEACKRVRAAGGELPSAKSQGKSLGGAYAI